MTIRTSHSAERSEEVSTGGENTVLPGRRGSLSLGCYWTAILRREGRKVKSGTALWLRIHLTMMSARSVGAIKVLNAAL